MQVRLSDLDPRWANNGDLIFDCPCCPKPPPESTQAPHRIAVPTRVPTRDGEVWQWNGEKNFDLVTLNPSVDCTKKSKCQFHGWIRDGWAQW